MKIHNLGIMSMGDMGSGVAKILKQNNFNVITSLENRSKESAIRAQQNKITDVGTLENLVENSDVILSILVPSKALGFAKQIAPLIAKSNREKIFVDCNAISPQTTKEINIIIEKSNGLFIDGGIIGGSPRSGEKPRIYISGKHANKIEVLHSKDVEFIDMKSEIGAASGLKMTYAAITKGTAALYAASLMTADHFGLLEKLLDEISYSQPRVFDSIKSVNSISAKAFRWIGEMEEIAETFKFSDNTGKFHIGAAEIFRKIALSPIGHERVDNIDKNRKLIETVRLLNSKK
ncbi:MAG: NAD(P)-binding domain-containing protein [Dehalococcoidia bacterium]